MIGTTTALILGGAAAAGKIGSAIIGSRGASKAAQAQEEAVRRAAGEMRGYSERALEFQKDIYAPWREVGEENLMTLADLMHTGEMTKRFEPSDIYTDPSYAFRLAEGQKALERSAAARGGLSTSGKELTRYAQGMASTEYQSAFDRFMREQEAKFGRLQAMAGYGERAGEAEAAGGRNILMSTGQTLADLETQAGAARASGYAGRARAWGEAVSGIGDLPMDIYTLSKIMKRQPTTTTGGYRSTSPSPWEEDWGLNN